MSHTFDRPLPYDLDAERALLGAILLGSPLASIAVQTEDFFLPENRVIFSRAQAVSSRGMAVDIVTLNDGLRNHGELEAAGGAGYLASLIDGVPRISNAEHYARIIREKSELRRLAHAGMALTNRVLEGDASADEVQTLARTLLLSSRSRTDSALRALSVGELMTSEVKSRAMLLSPVLPEQGLAMLHAYRGIGKTFLALGMAAAVAGGDRFLRWKAERARRVLYVDGELPLSTLRERVAMILAGMERVPSLESLQFVTPDAQKGVMPDLATSRGQRMLEPMVEVAELVILDNLSALCRAGVENEGESWLPVQEWALGLRRRGKSVQFIHHSGKNKAQRGTSRREDLLDTVITLKHPADYCASDGLRCEVHFEKTRAMLGDAAKPFEVQMVCGADGRALWTTRDLEDVNVQRALTLHREGLSVREIAEELGVSKSSAHRLLVKRSADGPGGVSHCPTP